MVALNVQLERWPDVDVLRRPGRWPEFARDQRFQTLLLFEMPLLDVEPESAANHQWCLKLANSRVEVQQCSQQQIHPHGADAWFSRQS